MDSARPIETVLMCLHCLRLLLRAPELQVHILCARRALKLLVLLVFGVGSLSRESEVDMLIARVLSESH